MNADFIMAVQELGKEKGIEPSILFEAVEEALVTAYKKNFGSKRILAAIRMYVLI